MNKSTKSTTKKITNLSELQLAPDAALVSIFNDYKELVTMIMSQVLEWQVIKLVGSRYEHQMTDRTHFRHGENPSSLRIGDEKVPIKVPRVRNMETKKCSSPELWNKIRSGIKPDIHQMYAVLNGISTRNYKDSVHTTLDGFGLSRNEVSENFIEYSEDLLQEFNERKWTENTYTALFIDGIDLGGQ